MNNSTFSQFNDFKKPFNLFNSSPKSQCLSQKKFKSTTHQDDYPAEWTAHCSSGTRLHSGFAREPPTKKFKPNTTGIRSRISFDGSEETFKNEGVYVRKHHLLSSHTAPSSNNLPQHDSRSSSISSTCSNDANGTDPGVGGGPKLSEDADEEGIYPLGGVRQSIFETIKGTTQYLFPESCTCSSGDKDRTVSGSTLTSPTLSSTTPNDINIARDLSLGRDESADSCEDGRSRTRKGSDDISNIPANSISAKIRAKLASKSCNCTASSDPKSVACEELLQRFKRVASENGFECLSTKCPSLDCPLTFRCKQKHTITTRDFSKTGTLTCPKCQKKLDRCIAYAKAHNGIFTTLTKHLRASH